MKNSYSLPYIYTYRTLLATALAAFIITCGFVDGNDSKVDQTRSKAMFVKAYKDCGDPIPDAPIDSNRYVYVSANEPCGNGSGDSPDNAIHGLEAARNLVRGKIPSMTNHITVYLLPGVYRLTSPLKLKGIDSGQNGKRVIWQSYFDRTATISGAADLSDLTWQKPDNKDWFYTSIPSNRIPDAMKPRLLFVDGKRAVRARSGALKKSRFFADPDASLPALHVNHNDPLQLNFGAWNNLSEVEMVGIAKWHSWRTKIDKYESENQWVFMHQAAWNFLTDKDEVDRDPENPRKNNFFQAGGGNRFGPLYIENALELLDQPNEWYIDFNENSTADPILYYHPKDGAIINSQTFELPVVESLINTVGEVKNMTWQGVHFAHTTFSGLNEDKSFHIEIQGPKYVDSSHFYPNGDDQDKRNNNPLKKMQAAVNFNRATNIILKHNSLNQLGTTGIRLGKGSKDNQILHNTVYDGSAGGVHVGDHGYLAADIGDDALDATRDNEIGYNKIYDVGKEFFGNVGIYGGHGLRTYIHHNEIFDLPYMGIQVGDGWQSRKGYARFYRIEYNHVHHVLQLLADGGAIYIVGAHGKPIVSYSESPATWIGESGNVKQEEGYSIIRYNHIHDIGPGRTHYASQSENERYPWHINTDVGGETYLRYANDGIRLDNGTRFVWVSDNIIENVARFRVRVNVGKEDGPPTDTAWCEEEAPNPEDCTEDGKPNIDYLGKLWPYVMQKNNEICLASAKAVHGVASQKYDANNDERKRREAADWRDRRCDAASECDFLFSHSIDCRWEPDSDTDVTRQNVIDQAGINDSAWLKKYDLSDPTLQDKAYKLPYNVMSDAKGDRGVRFVDLNGDGYKDVIYSRDEGSGVQKGFFILDIDEGDPGKTVTWKNNNSSTLYQDFIWNLRTFTSADGSDDFGVRFADFDGDGDDDIIYAHKITGGASSFGCYLNQQDTVGLGVNVWQACPNNSWQANQKTNPGWAGFGNLLITKTAQASRGVRFLDVNGDGLSDAIQSYWNGTTLNKNHVLLGSVGGWQAPVKNHNLSLDHHIGSVSHADLGVRFPDLDGDGIKDSIVARKVANGDWQYKAFLNVDSTPSDDTDYLREWQANSSFTLPQVLTDGRFTYDDPVPVGETSEAQLNEYQDSSGLSPQDRMNVVLAADNESKRGVKFIDLNEDGRDDLLVALWRNGEQDRRHYTAYINTGHGWVEAPYYRSSIALATNNTSTGDNGDLGVRFLDVDVADSRLEMLQFRWIDANTKQRRGFKLKSQAEIFE